MEILAVSFSSLVENAGNILCVALGLGLVIFIHELGHFAVAKWCGVKVERFSIGFGPILWRYTRGETEYALSAIPFGGYVKMLGQDDADPSQMADERIASDPRSYTAKPVPQRIAIISAGVINNMVSAVLFFIIAFMLGVKYNPAVVGQVIPGKPGWEAGLRTGDVITAVDGREDRKLAFLDVQRAIALSTANVPVQVKGLRNGRPFSATLHPVKLEDQLVPQIFVEPALGLTLATSTDPDHPSPTNPGFSSETADPPFKSGDRIVEIDGTPLKGDSFAELLSTLAARRGEVVLGVQRASKDGRPARTLTRIPFTPNHFRVLGLRMAIGKIAAIQTGSPAAGKLQVGDTITHVFENGAPRPVGAELDPMKLPDYFASRAGEEVQLKVKRETAEGNPTSLDVSLTPEPRAGWLERPSGDDCPLSVPAIGVAYHVTNHVVAVEPDSPAALAGIKEQDNIESVKLVPTADEKEKDRDAEKSATIRFRDEKKSRELRNWPRAFWLMQNFPLRTVVLEVRSQGGDPRTTEEITPKVDSEWFLPMLGLQMTPLTETRKADNIGEAVALGFRHTRDSIVDMWLTINGLIKGRISPKALGGPIRIAETAYYFSEKGIPDLILFLGILSVSLAVLNFLPIPVLDGGHFMFLCWEGIRGKPPSERVVVTATYLGLAVVLSLMAWVMYIDIASLIGGK